MRNAVPGNTSEDLGKLVLRVALAVLILFHGVAKIINGVGFITGLAAKFGLPPALGYLVYIGEVVAPLLILFGAWTRLAALIVAINMVAAVALVHMGDLLTLTKNGGWALELQALFLAAAIAVALLGAGRYSVGGIHGRMN
jgi:putative oxidoreductase